MSLYVKTTVVCNFYFLRVLAKWISVASYCTTSRLHRHVHATMISFKILTFCIYIVIFFPENVDVRVHAWVRNVAESHIQAVCNISSMSILVAGKSCQWSDWMAWSDCDVICGTGSQLRQRECRWRDGRGRCEADECEGPSRELRQCNVHSCQGQ